MPTSDSNSQPADGGGLVKRKRPAACIHCHQRKVRCDARTVGIPCSNCRTAGKHDCRIHEKKKRSLVRSVQHPIPIRCAPPPESKPPTSYSSLSNPVSHSTLPPTSVPNSKEQQNGLEISPHGSSEHTSPESLEDKEDNRERDRHLIRLIDEDFSHRSIERNVRVVYVGQDVSNLNFLLRQQRGDQDDEVYHFAANDISRRYLRQGFDQVPREAFVLPDQALADELVEAYFTHVNPGCPIIDEDMFMAQYRGRNPADPPSLLILQAILLVGAHVSRPRPARDTLKAAFFRRAKILFESRVERNRDLLVQAALLLTWHSDPVDDDVAANAHYWVGVAARIATGLGMHRNAGPSMLVPHDKRMWRRVWWILVQFDVMVSLQYGRPQAINLDDCDVQPLTPADFEGCGSRVQIDYVIQYTELCCMISFITRERFGLRVSPERRKAVVAEADKALANWSLMLPDTVRMSSSDMDSWPALLHLTYNNFLILLHRPHPKAAAYSDDYSPNDAEICSAAAGVIVSIFEELRAKDRLKYLWVSSVTALFTAMIQIRVELRFSNPVLAMNALRRFDSTMNSLRCLSEYWLSAETIFRLFESSKRLQRDLEMVKMNQPARKAKEEDDPTKPPAQLTPPMDPPGIQTHMEIWRPRPQFEESFTYFHKQPAAPTMEATGQAEEQEQQQQQTGPDQADWRQLFAFGDTDHSMPIIPENFPDMEDEWRDLYLHGPEMTDYFPDSSWLQG
ncbi:hypothetical protein VTO42DRAFT_5097 [Malbranchea cinnamomea]